MLILKYITLLLCCFIASNCIAQTTPEFSFTIYVYDALGNQDSMVLGYDVAASENADTQFADTNIANIAMDSTLELRATGLFSPLNYQSKNAILKYTCDGSLSINDAENMTYLMVRAKNFPISFVWDYNLFLGSNNACHRNSFIASSAIHFQYANINMPSIFHSVLSTANSYYVDYDKQYIDYRTTTLNNGVVDTVYMFPFSFIDTVIQVGINENMAAQNIEIYPNPAKDYVEIKMQQSIGAIQLSVFNLNGQEIPLSYSIAGDQITLNTSQLATGFYFCRINCDRKTYQVRFTKE